MVYSRDAHPAPPRGKTGSPPLRAQQDKTKSRFHWYTFFITLQMITIYTHLSNNWISWFIPSFAPPRGFLPSPRPADFFPRPAPPRSALPRWKKLCPAHPWFVNFIGKDAKKKRKILIERKPGTSINCSKITSHEKWIIYHFQVFGPSFEYNAPSQFFSDTLGRKLTNRKIKKEKNWENNYFLKKRMANVIEFVWSFEIPEKCLKIKKSPSSGLSLILTILLVMVLRYHFTSQNLELHFRRWKISQQCETALALKY